MRPLKAEDAIVDRCEKCYGIWVDPGERRKLLKDKSLVHGIDIGSPDVGQQQDEITEVKCPRCGGPVPVDAAGMFSCGYCGATLKL